MQVVDLTQAHFTVEQSDGAVSYRCEACGELFEYTNDQHDEVHFVVTMDLEGHRARCSRVEAPIASG